MITSLRRALAQGAAVREQQHAARGEERVAGIVRGEHDRVALGREAPRSRRSTRTWLPKSRLAVGSSSTSARAPAPARARSAQLALAAGELGDQALGEVPDAERARCARVGRLAVALRPGAANRPTCAVRPISTDLAHGEREVRAVALRHVADAARDLAAADIAASGAPSSAPSPACGGSRPSSVRNSVVLPPPLGPSTHSTSPAVSDSSTSAPDGRPG